MLKLETIRGALESAFLVVALVAGSGALEMARYEYLSPRLVNAAIVAGLVTAVLALLSHRRAAWVALGNAWPALLPVMLAWISLSWSSAPSLSLQRLIGLSAVTAIGLLIGTTRRSSEEHLRLVATALLIVMAITVAALLVEPNAALMQGVHEGIWRGWYSSRNHLARAMALAASISVLLSVSSARWDWTWIAGVFAPAALLMAVAGSRTAPVVTLVMMVGILATLRLRTRSAAAQRWTLRIVAVLGVTLVVFVSFFGWALLDLLGGDMALSLRGHIWRVVGDAAATHLWFGHGFGGFWQGEHGPSLIVRDRLGQYPWHAHSGFLELTLDLGLVGLAMFTIPFVMFWWRAMARALTSVARSDLWPMAYCLFFVVSNLDETELLRYDSIYWMLYVAVVASFNAPALRRDCR